jgi:hypothetical protein
VYSVASSPIIQNRPYPPTISEMTRAACHGRSRCRIGISTADSPMKTPNSMVTARA